MSNHAWVTRADVLKDLREVSGRNTGAADLDHYVVRGEMPPPARQDMEDEDEMQYHFGTAGVATGVDNHTPDLHGISRMLQIVDDLDATDSADTKTIYRNKLTDEISISKLNPNVSEFVPGGRKTLQIEPKLETSKVQLKTLSKLDLNGPQLIRRSDKTRGNRDSFKENDGPCTNGHLTNGKSFQNDIRAEISNISSSTITDTPKKKIGKESSVSGSTSALGKTTLSTSTLTSAGDISLDKKLDITKMKSDEIAAMKEKVKSKIIDSSQHNSLQRKREKNVAIATLLKLCTAPSVPTVDKPVKLVTPEYFQGTPRDDAKVDSVDEDVGCAKEEIEQTPPNAVNEKYVDPLVEESISKVNDWFNSTGKPKPKPPVVVPIQQPVTFIKKSTPNQSKRSTPKSEVSLGNKQSCGDFVPSAYANDLLQKYETNAKKVVGPREDLGTMLERRLKERDELMKKRLLEKNNAASPVSGRGVQ